ncbi:MAG: DUF4476 domain-containing protein [Bacteroidales bacterium]|nr:DUF4476 domain-containing protein [Bacteroidales bacterium]
MKKILFLFIFLIPAIFANAQFTSDMVFFSSTNQNFFVTIDNARVNSYPANKVRVNDISAGIHNILVTIPNNAKTMLVLPVNVPENVELAVVVSQNQLGVFFLETFVAIDYSSNSLNTDPTIVPLPPDQNNTSSGFCDAPMDQNAFNTALFALKNQDFDSDKLIVAKQIASTNCLLSEQVKTIMLDFDFESSKIDFAQFAYSHTFDPQNYYLVNEAFDFSSSIDKLNDYISSLD